MISFTSYRKRFFTLIVFCLIFSSSFSVLFGQNLDKPFCGSHDERERLLLEDNNYQIQSKSFENYYQDVVKNNIQPNTENMVVHTIPVVVHIIHDNAPLGSSANPTDAQIIQEINQATERFRHNHAGAGTYSNPFYGADSEIEFCLAGTDPNGSFTTGINRYNDGENSVGSYNTYGPIFNDLYAWDSDNYCNLFIMTDLTNAAGVYMGGFDFTIYDSGSFWEGLIAHEIGHYFNLRHTFQVTNSMAPCENNDCTADGDQVCDTPPKDVSGMAGGTCAAPSNSCTTDEDDTSTNNPYRPVGMGGMGDQVDMLANYMDYTGGCWDAFTEGQKTRMKADITANRQTLINNTVCDDAPILANDAGITFFKHDQENNCDGNITVEVTLKNYGSNTLTSTDIIIAFDGVTAVTYNWTGSLASQEQLEFYILPQVALNVGNVQLSVRTNMPNGVADANPNNDKPNDRSIEYLGGGGCEVFSDCATYNPNTASGPGNITTVTITESFPTASAGDQISLCVTTDGDNNFSGEIFDVSDENGIFIGQTSFAVSDCSGPTQVCFTVNVSDYNNWIADGSASFDFDPVSTSINPFLCTTNQACATLSVLYNNLPVIPDFYSDKNVICVNESVNFIDFSNPVPTSYTWTFSPSTVTFINGTNANSANPNVQFNSGGIYTVSLNATNASGGGTETKTDYIRVALLEDEDFESLTFCSNGNDCELTVCPLGLGWDNKTNGTDDDIDWRSDFGGTWSDNTGPDVDHNPGTAAGIYLYLEASSCYSKTAHLETNQCLSIPSTGTTELSFWYHMYGADMGSLHVDAKVGSTWTNDIATSISGDQGNVWHNWVIDLSSYAGQSITLRIRGITGTFWGSDMAIDDIVFNYTPPAGTTSYYPDTDNDGYGDMNANAVQGNSPPPGHVLDNTDCDDTNGNIFPGNTEVCDGFDNNCDNVVDEGFDMDNDNVSDCTDNCPEISNSSQTDSDGDNYGDECDCDPNNSNDTDRNIHNNPITSDTYWANNSINSHGIVPNTNTVEFKAGYVIDLKPNGANGFIAHAGSDFIAKIENCIPPPPLIGNQTEEIEMYDELEIHSSNSQVNTPIGINIFPNPFNQKASIEVTIEEPQLVSLIIYDGTGSVVKQILDSKFLETGTYNFTVNGENWGMGLFHTIVKTADQTIVRKMIILR